MLLDENGFYAQSLDEWIRYEQLVPDDPEAEKAIKELAKRPPTRQEGPKEFCPLAGQIRTQQPEPLSPEDVAEPWRGAWSGFLTAKTQTASAEHPGNDAADSDRSLDA